MKVVATFLLFLAIGSTASAHSNDPNMGTSAALLGSTIALPVATIMATSSIVSGERKAVIKAAVPSAIEYLQGYGPDKFFEAGLQVLNESKIGYKSLDEAAVLIIAISEKL